MERHVKERLVGAAVLVAAAVVLIPEMLSGPHREQRNQPAGKSGEPPLKTYTIDLSQSPAAQGSTATPEKAPQPTVIEEPAPPPEDSAAPEPADAAASPSSEPATGQATPESPPVENQPQDATSVPAPAEHVAAAPSQRDVAPPATPPAVNEAPPLRAEKPGENVPANASGNAWAVQLASLDDQAAADGMSKQLRGKGYEAFVMPFKKGGTTRYRVRIGPMKDRQAASEILRKVKETTPDAIVVSHP